MERSPWSTSSQKKEIQEEDNVASNNDVLERSSSWTSEGWQENAGWKTGPLSTRSRPSSQEQRCKDTPRFEVEKRFRNFCTKQRRQSRKQKPYGTRVVRKVRKGRRTSGHMPKNYERKAAKMTETGRFLWVASDVSNKRKLRREHKKCWKRE